MLREEFKSIPSTDRDVRKFGLTIGVVLLLLAAFFWWKEKPSAIHFAFAAALFAATTWLWPRLMRPLYLAWMAFAVVMGFFMTRVILTVLYFGMFTPIALALKIFGKDLLQERMDKSATTYWIKRARETYEPQSSERMF
ncbi:MAG: hypothetical protein AAB354_05625 [candidate division KSB1 bacterium]